MNSETQIIRTEYSDLMKKSYIDYAMSVIISRALPDVRDGLKPVQRRTLYDMYELGIRYDRPYRKCARIVGDTMGKYHPHGDSSIYEALVVMAQDFKKGQILVDGHGNFGSIEGDGAAAMRYTEARLTKFTQEVCLADLDKNVIDFGPNFDETEKEPLVLPVRIPNLLVNGAEGIAVGMATSIPTHNLAEVVDAVKAYMKNDAISTRQLMKYIKGPDFPTGGIVVNKDDLLDIYETGQGKIKIRGKVEVEELKGGKKQLVISEIPYTMIGSGISKFLNDVASLVESKKTTDIVDISNQSSKEGIRIVLELKRGADVENLKNMLYKKTRLEDTFGVNMLAVADGRPETLGLKKIIEYHVDFQFELATRKYQTLLAKEREKSEVQEGLIKACDVIDLVIEILRGSKSVKDARACLVNGVTDNIKFKSNISKKMASLLRFTERQATAILEMRLYRLIGLEIQALRAEHEQTLKNIARYEDILKQSVRRRFEQELTEVIPEDRAGDFNQSLIELGAIVCVPNGAPLCGECPWQALCRAHLAGEEENYPVRSEKKARRVVDATVLVLQCGDKFALEKRPAKGLLAGLWQFPFFEGDAPDLGEVVAEKRAKHIFTHVEWRMRGKLVRIDAELPRYVWATADEIARTYAVPSAFRAFMEWVR